MAKKFNLDPLITHTLNLDKINEAVELMRTGKWQVAHIVFMSECLGPRNRSVGTGGGSKQEVKGCNLRFQEFVKHFLLLYILFYSQFIKYVILKILKCSTALTNNI